MEAVEQEKKVGACVSRMNGGSDDKSGSEIPAKLYTYIRYRKLGMRLELDKLEELQVRADTYLLFTYVYMYIHTILSTSKAEMKQSRLLHVWSGRTKKGIVPA
jgi:hypothetical protein